jgi:uncharacterized protein with HEPN domain
MSLSPPDREYLGDMLDWARKAQRFVAGMSEEQFLRDERTQSAVLHALIVIGEAANRISDDMRAAQPDIPCYEIRGMRNRLAHDDLGVDMDAVWRAVSVELPALSLTLERVLAGRKG